MALTVVTFRYTGSAQGWTVPAEVDSLAVTAIGGSGGWGWGQLGPIPAPWFTGGLWLPDGRPGFGAITTATVPVTAGDELSIYVGAAGADCLNLPLRFGPGGIGPYCLGGAGGWGWHPGGQGGPDWLGPLVFPGGGGGGSSAVVDVTASDELLIEAAGGGGSPSCIARPQPGWLDAVFSYAGACYGGNAGNTDGSGFDGQNGGFGGGPDGDGGGGGSGPYAGQPGAYDDYGGGLGGPFGEPSIPYPLTIDGGGGGGGGWRCGGGGGPDGGGGAGACYACETATDVAFSTAAAWGAGLVIVTFSPFTEPIMAVV